MVVEMQEEPPVPANDTEAQVEGSLRSMQTKSIQTVYYR